MTTRTPPEIEQYIADRERQKTDIQQLRESGGTPEEWRPFLNDAIAEIERELDRAKAILNCPENNPMV